MSPFIAIAGSVLPEILKTILSKKHHDSVDVVSNAIEEAVKGATKSNDPVKATEIIEQNPQIAADLRIRLAEIAAEQDQAERESDEKKREVERQAQEEIREFGLRQIEAKHAQSMEFLKTDLAANEAKRQQEFTNFKERLLDVRDAREGFERLAASGSKFAWAPPVISTIIVVGFFSILAVLLLIEIPGLDLETDKGERLFQTINIVIGALTAAFATVVSFWLGSSQGSKQKDIDTLTMEKRRITTEDRREERFLEHVATAPYVQETSPILESTEAAPKRKLANETNFTRCIGPILEAEGGFVDHPNDPGGATNMGITFNTLKSWRQPDSITVDDVRNLTEDEAKQIYRANYWNAIGCDDLPDGVDLVTFDFGVNAGPGRSVKTLQRVIGVKDDGAIGPITLAAVAAVEPEHIVRRFGELRMEFYRRLSTFPTFGKGWARRVQKVEAQALALLRKG